MDMAVIKEIEALRKMTVGSLRDAGAPYFRR